MISTDKVETTINSSDSNVATSNKPHKWNEQPHIGKYKLIKTIGKGNFAKVKLAQHVTTAKKVAVKVIDKTALNSSSLNKLFREVRIMKTLDHPNIVKLFEVIESERHVYLVMEYAPKGEVFDYLVQNGRMKEKEARQRFREIVSAIQYCHQKNIVHRDLKAENLLLGNDNQIKIADFGFANTFDCKKQLDTFCGSPPYAAPELFQGRKYDGPEVDVWSLGVILYTLVSGSLPFDGHNMRELRERVLRGKYRIPFYMSTDCEMLLKKMLVVNPQKRYTLLDAMKDKWINIGFEDSPMQPYKEPTRNYEDAQKINHMEQMGFSKDEVLDSLYNARFNNVTATYLLLDFDNNQLDQNSKSSESVSSLKNVSTFQNTKENQKNLAVSNTHTDNSSSKGIARSGSAVDSKLSNKVNGDTKDQFMKSNINESTDRSKSSGRSSNIKQSPSSGGTSNAIIQQDDHQKHKTAQTIRIPGIQPNFQNNTSMVNSHHQQKLANQNSGSGSTGLSNDHFNNGDNHLFVPNSNKQNPNVVITATTAGTATTNTATTNQNWVKRNNTFTYADKNTTSEMESRPVVRTKNVMNMYSHVTPATIPLPMDTMKKTSSRKERQMTGGNSGVSLGRNSSSATPEEVCQGGGDLMSGAPCQITPPINVTSTISNAHTTGYIGGGVISTTQNTSTTSTSFHNQHQQQMQQSINDKPPSATGDKYVTNNTLSSIDDSSNVLLVSSEDTPSSSNKTQLNTQSQQQQVQTNDVVLPSEQSSSITTGGAQSPINPQMNKTPNSFNNSPYDEEKDQANIYPSLNKPRPTHSSSLFRSFTNRISSSKLIRRLTSQNPPSNRNKRLKDPSNYEPSNDPWTPRDHSSKSTSNDKQSRHMSGSSSDYSGADKRCSNTSDNRKMYKGGNYTLPNPSNQDKMTFEPYPNPGQIKPRIMHLIFRKSLTCKIRPAELIITEILRCLQPCLFPIPGDIPSTHIATNTDPPLSSKSSEWIQLHRMEQIAPFVISCQGRLSPDHPLSGGNNSSEIIRWDIEVFRLARPGGSSSSHNNTTTTHNHVTQNNNPPLKSTTTSSSTSSSSTSYSGSYVLRIKKQHGSNTRFKAIHKLLVAKLTPPLTNTTIISPPQQKQSLTQITPSSTTTAAISATIDK